MWLGCLLLTIIPHDDVRREHCDAIEVNHYYSESGCLVFCQVMFLDYHWDGRLHVRSWRMLDRCAMPRYDRERKAWSVLWKDGEVWREVTADAYRESWTQDGHEGDPEVNDRAVVPKELRRELSGKQ